MLCGLINMIHFFKQYIILFLADLVTLVTLDVTQPTLYLDNARLSTCVFARFIRTPSGKLVYTAREKILTVCSNIWIRWHRVPTPCYWTNLHHVVRARNILGERFYASPLVSATNRSCNTWCYAKWPIPLLTVSLSCYYWEQVSIHVYCWKHEYLHF